MAFVFLSSDALDQRFRANSKSLGDNQNDFMRGASLAVRRPYRGIQIKDDVFATISIVDGRGKNIPLVSESAIGEVGPTRQGYVDQYADFILQTVSEERVEKQQIIETFGDSFIFFLGERPQLINITGLLVNTEDFNWWNQWRFNYENYLRGTKLVQRNARAFLAYDSRVLEGYPISFSANENSENTYVVQFTMTMFLTNQADFSRIGIVDFPGTGQQLPNLAALNRELTDAARRYPNTGADVRRAAVEAGEGRFSLSSSLREGIRSINNVTSLVGNTLNGLNTLLSGRVVTVPVGVAGFIEQVGQGSVISQDAIETLDSATSKVKMARTALFAPVNPDIWRTRFSANVDEYPLREQFALDHGPGLRMEDFVAAKERQAVREAKRKEHNLQLVAFDLAAQKKNTALTAIADAVNFTKKGFALYTTADAALDDPGGVIGTSLGVGRI